MEKSLQEIEKLCARISTIARKNSEILKGIPHPNDYFVLRGQRFADYVKRINTPETSIHRLKMLKLQLDQTIAKYKSKSNPR